MGNQVGLGRFTMSKLTKWSSRFVLSCLLMLLTYRHCVVGSCNLHHLGLLPFANVCVYIICDNWILLPGQGGGGISLTPVFLDFVQIHSVGVSSLCPDCLFYSAFFPPYSFLG